MCEDNELDEKKKRKSISAQNYHVNCPVDPGSIQGSHWPISLTREHLLGTEYARTAYHTICKFSKKWDVDETYHVACTAEYQLFNQSNSQLTYFRISYNNTGEKIGADTSQRNVVCMSYGRLYTHADRICRGGICTTRLLRTFAPLWWGSST